MPALGIDLEFYALVHGLHVVHGEPGHAFVAADGIGAAARDEYGQAGRNPGQRLVRPQREQAAEEIQPQAAGKRASAKRIGQVAIHFIFVARQPVHLGPDGPERPVERVEAERVDEIAVTAFADPE